MGSRGAERVRPALLRALLAGVVCSLILPSVAGAQPGIGIVDEPSPAPSKIILYQAAGNQHNDVTVAQAGTNFIVSDGGATAIPDLDGAGTGCEPVNATTYTCPDPLAKTTCFDPAAPDDRTIRRVTIRTGDEDDVITVEPSVSLDSALFSHTGNDLVTGGKCTDWIQAGPTSGNAVDGNGNPLDDDIVFAGAGDDHLDGGIGDDELHPGFGSDAIGVDNIGIIGGSGTDTLSYSERNTPVRIDISDSVGLAGETAEKCTLRTIGDVFVEFDTMHRGDLQVEHIEGGGGDDCLTGSRFANTIRGGLGADLLSGEQGNDTVDYTDRSATSPVTVSLGDGPNDGAPGEGDDVISDVENITGGAGDDLLIGQDRVAPTAGINPRGGQEGANRLEGLGGNDTLVGKGDSDQFDGGAGTDTVSYGEIRLPTGEVIAARTESIVGSIGDGTNDDGSAQDVNTLTSRGDAIEGSVENVVGGDGGDVLRGTAEANFLDGGGGDDTLNGGAGNDVLLGGAGNDLIEGAQENDTLRGAAGDDSLEGGVGNDTLEGGDDFDLLDGNEGVDTLVGGSGLDAADYSARLGPVAASADSIGGDGERDIDPARPGAQSEGDTIADDVEDLLGGIDDDTLVGNRGDGLLQGGGGDDELDGGGGPDVLIGGPGADRATYASRGASVVVDLRTAGGDGEPGENDDIADDVEKVQGGAGNDTLIGDAASSIIGGGAGADTIDGGDGFDLLHGHEGNDTMNGSGGTDQLFGDDGNDVLVGGSDADTLSGGGNDDSLDGGTGADVLNGNQGSDTANFATRTSGVQVTLDGAPNDGQSSEGDLVKKDVESVSTGSGNDTINSADGQAGRISCGRGTDKIDARDASDRIGEDCENVGALDTCNVRAANRGRMSRSGRVRLRVSCGRAAGRTSLTLRRGKSKIGSKRFTVRTGKVKVVKVKLNKKGRRAVKRAKRNRLRVRATVGAVRSRQARITRANTRRITIRAPR